MINTRSSIVYNRFPKETRGKSGIFIHGRKFSLKIAGIICEYNPFHLGHARQLAEIRQQLGDSTAIVCVMSGNYVQRGMPAMWDKFSRARAAVACGADVVLELPITKVLQSAEGFARGGVEILHRFGVDYLSFGAECGDGSALMSLARRLDDPAVTATLQDYLRQGQPYAAARQKALNDTDDLLRSPNNILGLEYCRALLALNSSIEPLVIARTGDYHAQVPDPQAPSATAVRSLVPDGPWQQYLPREAAELLSQVPWYDLSWGERAVLARLRSLHDWEWEACAHGSEGLWRKAMKAARSQPDFESVVQAIKSKRYPRTRIQRLLLCAYLGISQSDLSRPISYSRILAFSPQGQKLLRTAKKRGEISLFNPGAAPDDLNFYQLEIRCSDLFSLFSEPSFPASCRMEQTARLFEKKF